MSTTREGRRLAERSATSTSDEDLKLSSQPKKMTKSEKRGILQNKSATGSENWNEVLQRMYRRLPPSYKALLSQHGGFTCMIERSGDEVMDTFRFLNAKVRVADADPVPARELVEYLQKHPEIAERIELLKTIVERRIFESLSNKPDITHMFEQETEAYRRRLGYHAASEVEKIVIYQVASPGRCVRSLPHMLLALSKLSGLSSGTADIRALKRA